MVPILGCTMCAGVTSPARHTEHPPGNIPSPAAPGDPGPALAFEYLIIWLGVQSSQAPLGILTTSTPTAVLRTQLYLTSSQSHPGLIEGGTVGLTVGHSSLQSIGGKFRPLLHPAVGRMYPGSGVSY